MIGSLDIARLARFGTVGVVVACIYVLVYGTLRRLGLEAFVSNIIAFLLAVAFQYLGQTWWTFQRPLLNRNQYYRFGVMILTGVLFSGVITSWLAPILNWSPWLAAGVVAVTLPFVNYAIMSHWVYRDSRDRRNAKMRHDYSSQFFDYIDDGARRSARSLIATVSDWLRPSSVLDLGCGRGVWLDEWSKSGSKDIFGIDGSYVDRSKLAIADEHFVAADLTIVQELGRAFDLSQSLEVGEHLPVESSEALVKSLTAHADLVLFSAAVPGQGGENHINEKPLQFWRNLFLAEGFRAYDCVRPALHGNTEVEPWYRYNTVLYANEAGEQRLPDHVIKTQVPEGERLREIGSLPWRLRRLIVSAMPLGMATWIAQKNAARVARIAREKAQ